MGCEFAFTATLSTVYFLSQRFVRGEPEMRMALSHEAGMDTYA